LYTEKDKNWFGLLENQYLLVVDKTARLLTTTKFEAEKRWNAWTSRVYNIFDKGQ